MVENPTSLPATSGRGRRYCAAREAEARGFKGLFSEAPVTTLHLARVLDRTERIPFGTVIAGIYLRHPHTSDRGILDQYAPDFCWALALHTCRFTRRWEFATASLWTTCGATYRTYAP